MVSGVWEPTSHTPGPSLPQMRRDTGQRCLTLPSSAIWHRGGRPAAVNVIVDGTPSRGTTNRSPHIAHVRTS